MFQSTSEYTLMTPGAHMMLVCTAKYKDANNKLTGAFKDTISSVPHWTEGSGEIYSCCIVGQGGGKGPGEAHFCRRSAHEVKCWRQNSKQSGTRNRNN